MSYMVRCRELRSMDLRHQENAHDNIPSQKYRDAGFPRYFLSFSAVDSFYKNTTPNIIVLLSTGYRGIKQACGNNCTYTILAKYNVQHSLLQQLRLKSL